MKNSTAQFTQLSNFKRLQRTSICYSRSVKMHDIVIGLYINKYEFDSEGHCFASSLSNRHVGLDI
ncbi:IS1 family transposase [Pleurocapsa sp. PCC 7319]|uniref:IS1 family transposase n=1 Tax=Pleurocapsa sp. PCC 7319 TaxID=118161 RepID=UPI00130E2AB6